jgi:hypothetical protein
MTRKHYIEFAALFAGDLATCSTESEKIKVRGIIYSFADICKRDNSNFDRERFYAACGYSRYN